MPGSRARHLRRRRAASASRAALKRFGKIRVLEDVNRGENPDEGILSALIVMFSPGLLAFFREHDQVSGEMALRGG